MHRFFLLLDSNDIFRAVYSNFCENTLIFKGLKRNFTGVINLLNQLSIRYQSYPKSRKIDAFEKIICTCDNITNKFVGKVDNLQPL